MSRSVKKGPFIQPALLKRVQQMNETGDKKGFEDLVASQHDFPDFVGHTVAVLDDARTFRYM